ncbi:MAG: hypothetical protein L3K09_00745 [Thermoplasmata archaeon]|nr:hypothetical protein [Thermoplasmata archaeon]
MAEDPTATWAYLAQGETFAVVGLGGAGCEAVHDLVELGVPGVHAFAVNTDARHLLRVKVEERILLGQRKLKGRGSGGDRIAVVEAAEEGRDELVGRLSRFEIVFLLAGLGGGTGSALLPYLSAALRRTDALAIPIGFLPFQVEIDANSERRENVATTLRELEDLGGLLLLIANEKLRRFESLPVPKVFHLRNTYLHQLVTSLVDMVEHPSQLNVDLGSLKSHLRNGGLSTLLCSEYHVSDPDRLVQEALNGSLLDFHIGESPSALLHLDGGSNLTLRTLDRVLRSVRTRFGEPRRLILGTRLHPEARDVVRLTAVVGGVESRSSRPAPRAEPVEPELIPTVR